MSANAIQVGGDHYKSADFQPWDLIETHGLGFIEGNIVKYLTRWRKKGGVQDLEKVRHYVLKLEELAEAGIRSPRVVGNGIGPMVLSQYFQAHGITDFREMILISIFCSNWTERSFSHALLLVGSLIESASHGQEP